MQKTLSVKKIVYSIDGRTILDGVSFVCTQHERLCLFGENGAGKSTLMKIVTGELVVDSGLVQTEGHTRFAYVAQEFSTSNNDLTIGGYITKIAGVQLKARVYAITETLGYLRPQTGDVTCGSLSGGQQKILALAVALAQNPDYLLLDEPENHLDIISRLALIDILTAFTGGIIFVSHDRLLIDSLATKIGEITHGTFHLSAGGYAEYIEAKFNRIGGLQRTYDAESKRIRDLTKSIVILKQKAALGKDTAQYRLRKKELDDLKAAHKQSGRPADTKTKISLGQPGTGLHTGKLLFRIAHGGFSYGDGLIIFSDTNLELRSGAKVILLGRNGSGKSTFLKCLLGELPLRVGHSTIATNITVAYFDQHAEFQPESNALEIIKTALHIPEEMAISLLGAMKFDTGRMKSPVEILSGGERMRLRFAVVFGQKPDLLILDEPTNHIDEVTWEILLQACRDFQGTILLVSHDYEFIKAFPETTFWVIQDHMVVERQKDLDTLIAEFSIPPRKKKTQKNAS